MPFLCSKHALVEGAPEGRDPRLFNQFRQRPPRRYDGFTTAPKGGQEQLFRSCGALPYVNYPLERSPRPLTREPVIGSADLDIACALN